VSAQLHEAIIRRSASHKRIVGLQQRGPAGRTRTLFRADDGVRRGHRRLFALGLAMALVLVDFQRLRRSTDLDSAPLLAASIFLDVLNVFLFFPRIFSRGD
jgi:hypothetical protein